MGTPERSTGFEVVLALLIGSLFPLALLGSQTRTVTTAWTVKYVSGSERISLTPRRKHFVVYLRQGDKIKVQVGKDEITFTLAQRLVALFGQQWKKVFLGIPVSEVTQIAYDHKSHRLSKKVGAGMKGFGNCSDLGCGFVLMGGAAAMIATLPFKYTDYFVQILWRENGTMHAIEVKLGRKDSQAFLNTLQNFANVQAGQEPPIPKGSKVYIAPMGGFETYLERAFLKQKVPLEIVSDKSQADFVINGNAESQRAPLAVLSHSTEDASIIVTNLKTGKVVYAYAVHKQSSYHGERSTAEACAKHLKQRIRP